MTFFSNYASKVHDIRNFVQKWEIEMSRGVGLPAPIIGACIAGLKAYLQVNYLATLVMITNLTAHIFVCTYIQFLLSYTSNFPVSYSDLRTSVSYNFNGYSAHCIQYVRIYLCMCACAYYVHVQLCNYRKKLDRTGIIFKASTTIPNCILHSFLDFSMEW